MKKTWMILLTAILIVLLGACSGGKTGTDGADFSYVIREDGKSIEITACEVEEKIIEVPAEIDGFPVRSIGTYAFYGCEAEEICLPDSLEYVAGHAFVGCPNLISIDFGRGVMATGEYVCAYCDKLETLRFYDGFEFLGNPMLGPCPALEALYLPASTLNETASIGSVTDCPKLVVYTPANTISEKIALTDGFPVENLPMEDFYWSRSS